jgi:hypothetical protein
MSQRTVCLGTPNGTLIGKVRHFEPGPHIALLETLDVNGKARDSVGLDAPEISPRKKVSDYKGFVVRDACFLISLVAEGSQVFKRNALGTY